MPQPRILLPGLNNSSFQLLLLRCLSFTRFPLDSLLFSHIFSKHDFPYQIHCSRSIKNSVEHKRKMVKEVTKCLSLIFFWILCLKQRPTRGVRINALLQKKRQQQWCNECLSPNMSWLMFPRNKRKLNQSKGLFLLLPLRPMFFNSQPLIPNLIMKNHKGCFVPP